MPAIDVGVFVNMFMYFVVKILYGRNVHTSFLLCHLLIIFATNRAGGYFPQFKVEGEKP